MCIVSLFPRGIKKDTKEVYDSIKQGMCSNPSGSGFAVKFNSRKKDKIWLSKGYMIEHLLIEDIKNLKIGDDDELMVHHRIPTQGKVNELNCHPFIVSNDDNNLSIIEGFTNLPVLAHNGHFHNISKNNKSQQYSDTYIFCRDFLSIPGLMNLLLESPELFADTFDDLLGWSKFGILFEDRDFFKFGSGFVEDEGCFHSNSGYKKYVYNRGGVETDEGAEYDNLESLWNPNYLPINRQLPARQEVIGFGAVEETPSSNFKEYIRESKPYIVLNDLIPQITDKNWNHFYLVSNKENGSIDKGEYCEFDEVLPEDCPVEVVTIYELNKDMSRKNTGWIRNIKGIYLAFDLTPKPEYEEQYKDYAYLRHKKAYTHSAYKKLKKALSIGSNKKKVKLKDMKDLVNKEAVILIEKEWEVKENERSSEKQESVNI